MLLLGDDSLDYVSHTSVTFQQTIQKCLSKSMLVHYDDNVDYVIYVLIYWKRYNKI